MAVKEHERDGIKDTECFFSVVKEKDTLLGTVDQVIFEESNVKADGPTDGVFAGTGDSKAREDATETESTSGTTMTGSTRRMFRM